MLNKREEYQSSKNISSLPLFKLPKSWVAGQQTCHNCGCWPQEAKLLGVTLWWGPLWRNSQWRVPWPHLAVIPRWSVGVSRAHTSHGHLRQKVFSLLLYLLLLINLLLTPISFCWPAFWQDKLNQFERRWVMDTLCGFADSSWWPACQSSKLALDVLHPGNGPLLSRNSL